MKDNYSPDATTPSGFVPLQKVLDDSWAKVERRPAIERARAKLAQRRTEQESTNR